MIIAEQQVFWEKKSCFLPFLHLSSAQIPRGLKQWIEHTHAAELKCKVEVK